MGGTPKRSLSVSFYATGPIAAATVKRVWPCHPLNCHFLVVDAAFGARLRFVADGAGRVKNVGPQLLLRLRQKVVRGRTTRSTIAQGRLYEERAGASW